MPIECKRSTIASRLPPTDLSIFCSHLSFVSCSSGITRAWNEKGLASPFAASAWSHFPSTLHAAVRFWRRATRKAPITGDAAATLLDFLGFVAGRKPQLRGRPRKAFLQPSERESCRVEISNIQPTLFSHMGSPSAGRGIGGGASVPIVGRFWTAYTALGASCSRSHGCGTGMSPPNPVTG